MKLINNQEYVRHTAEKYVNLNRKNDLKKINIIRKIWVVY